jgi:hypothetical protein
MKTRPSRGASECTSFIRRVPEAIWAARDRKLEEAREVRAKRRREAREEGKAA